MSEPALDLSEIIDLYKADARRMVDEMRRAMTQWEEIRQGGKACKELRRLSHQLRGSGRTYGFRDVTRICKAMEHIVIKIETHAVSADEHVRNSLAVKIDRLSAIFG